MTTQAMLTSHAIDAMGDHSYGRARLALHRSICALAVMLATLGGTLSPATAQELVCWAEPAAVPMGSAAQAQLRSVVIGGPAVDSAEWQWVADHGHVESEGASATWQLGDVRLDDLQERRVVRAKLPWPGSGDRYCVVEVIVSRPDPALAGLPARDIGLPSPRITARRFLLPQAPEEDGYGLYSYLLFRAPPRDDLQRQRYLKVIESLLTSLRDAEELERHTAKGRLNVTYIPVTVRPVFDKDISVMSLRVLEHYDYAAAQTLLASVRETRSDGPFLVSTVAGLRAAKLASTNTALNEDLSGVMPDVAWRWVRLFEYLAARERSWTQTSLDRFGLQLRNAVAAGALVLPAAIGLRR